MVRPSALFFSAGVAARTCSQVDEGVSTLGVLIEKECGGLKESDCCARCFYQRTNCVAVDNRAGCCYYYSSVQSTQVDPSSTRITNGPAPPTPTPSPVPTPPSPVPTPPTPTPRPTPTPAPVKGSFCDQPGWGIVWEDEFDGPTLNDENWNVMVGHDEGTLRAALGTQEDVYLEAGDLVLRTRFDGFDPDVPRPENCTALMESTDALGGTGVATTSAADVGECCDQCRNNPTCGYFTYLPGGWGCDVGCCYHKSADVTDFNTSSPGCTSGHVPGAGTYKSGAVVSGGSHGGSSVPVGHADQSWMYGRFCVRAKLPGVEAGQSTTRPNNCSTLMQNTDVLGAGGVATLSAQDEGQCCDMCRDHALCSYFVYMKGAWGCNVGCCYLKDSGVTAFDTNAPGRIAGFVPGAADKSQGIWPAHWMMPDVEDCWPTKGEIDVMEMINGDGTYHGTMHWSGNGACGNDAANGGDSAAPSTWASEYHEYALEWTADHMHFVVDGEVKHTALPGSRPSYGGPTSTTFINEKYYWLLNTAVGKNGAWAGPPGPNTVFPAYHRIDYVRVAKPTAEVAV